MKLSSPNYPNWYNADGVGCEWLITAPEGFIIALEFNHFQVNNLLDFVMKFPKILYIIVFPHYKLWDSTSYFVSLYDGTCDQTKELETLTGTMPNDDKWVISSSGHHMFVSFNVAFSVSYPGFLSKIHYGKTIQY